ncbi:DUF2807 domain-containing protein [Parasphingorhabdus sp. JC815]|uniref:GIN domain-containing protein n=1 Tax=Parasphingorhabdus sp. JC815 TaxID=3232140 RepID=UPI00345910A7
MKKLFSLLGILVAIALIQMSPAHAAERTFLISSFEDVRIIGSVNVTITTDRGVSASAEAANREILDRVSLRKSGSQLIISVKPRTDKNSRYSTDEPVSVRLSSHVVKSITHSGSGAVSLDKLGGRDARVRLGGFGVLTIDDVDSDTLTITMNGGGQLVMAGQANKGRITLLGSSIFDGSALTLDTLDLIQRGPASSHVFVKREANISNSGTGIIQIDGKPDCSVQTGGAAQITCDSKR